MNFLDIIIAIPIVFMGIGGIKNGVISEILSIVALIAGIFLAIHFSDQVCVWLNFDSNYSSIIAFLVTFLAVVIAVLLLGKSLSFLANKLSLGFINKSLGLVFGALKALIFVGVLIYLWNLVDSDEHILTAAKRDSSFAFRTIETFADKFLPQILNSLTGLF